MEARARAVHRRAGRREPKRSQTGGWNVRYRRGWKGARVRELLSLIERRTPSLRVGYAF